MEVLTPRTRRPGLGEPAKQLQLLDAALLTRQY